MEVHSSVVMCELNPREVSASVVTSVVIRTLVCVDGDTSASEWKDMATSCEL